MADERTLFYRHVDAELQRSQAAVTLERFVRAWRDAGTSWEAISRKICAHYVSDGPTDETLRQWFTCRICGGETFHQADCPNQPREGS